MTRNNALYFPYINAPSSSWFIRILLYWDRISSIVPSDFAFNPERLQPHMRDLLAAELVEQVVPAEHIPNIQDFGEPFLDFVHEQIASRSTTDQNEDTFRIHLEKIQEVSEPLIQLGLARQSEYPWFEVEGWVARAFMTYLSTVLGCQAQVDAAPVTHDRSYLSFLESANHELNAPIETKRLATSSLLLESLLPFPVVDLEIDDLLGFKAKYAKQLTSLRNHVEKVCNEIVLQPPGEARERQVEIVRAELAKEVIDLEDAMKSRWKRVAFGALSSIGSGALSAWQAYLDQYPAAIAAAGFGLIPALYRLVTGDQQYEEALRRPLAYAALANLNFGDSSA